MFIFFFFNASLVEILRRGLIFLSVIFFPLFFTSSFILELCFPTAPSLALGSRRMRAPSSHTVAGGGGEEGEGGCEAMLYRWKGITRGLLAPVVHMACFRGA